MTERLALTPAPHAALGATPRSTTGVDFALWAPHAERVVLCVFSEDGQHERAHADLHGPRAAGWQGVWHGHLLQAQAGLVYGYRVHGPWAPQDGHRFNPNKVLLDPYAQDVVGSYRAQTSFLGHDLDHPDRASPVDNAADALKARVIEPWLPLPRLQHRVPDDEVVLYELHVKGATRRHPDVPETLHGSYAGVAHPAFIDHLRRLGVTTVSLLPVHLRADEARLQQMGLSNYWGYSSIAYFAAEPRYWSGSPGGTPMSEFRDMVQALHAAGLEVVLDVVFNHTAETDEFGPTLSFRGIDNLAYYHLRKAGGCHYENWTGCGNALKLSEPRVTQFVVDALRHWVEVGGVDGFRFDLAPELARGPHGYTQAAGFFAAVQADPVLRGVRLIAEPWDIGPGGYQLGHFPPPWREWNDRYRDTVRAFWLTGSASRGDFAHALAGSSNQFRQPGRNALASVNFITAHDGFTLRDLVSYNHRHNAANGEHNRDGHHHNLSWNCGHEGPCLEAPVQALRGRLQRALLTTLFVSQGTPMLLAGDEIGHTQWGNNNAYCQDNDTTWLQWTDADDALAHFVQRLLALRRAQPALRQAQWHSSAVADDGEPDLAWFTPHGQAMSTADWEQAGALPLQVCFNDAPGGRAVLHRPGFHLDAPLHVGARQSGAPVGGGVQHRVQHAGVAQHLGAGGRRRQGDGLAIAVHRHAVQHVAQALRQVQPLHRLPHRALASRAICWPRKPTRRAPSISVRSACRPWRSMRPLLARVCTRSSAAVSGAATSAPMRATTSPSVGAAGWCARVWDSVERVDGMVQGSSSVIAGSGWQAGGSSKSVTGCCSLRSADQRVICRSFV